MEHWDEGVHMIRGKGASGAVPLILSCGVHGDELTPVPVVETLLADLQARRLLPLHPCLLIFANPPALAERIAPLVTVVTLLLAGSGPNSRPRRRR